MGSPSKVTSLAFEKASPTLTDSIFLRYGYLVSHTKAEDYQEFPTTRKFLLSNFATGFRNLNQTQTRFSDTTESSYDLPDPCRQGHV